MLLLMFIGLFTSRVVLKALGVNDYGIYNAVGGVVTMFTFITTSISSAISRYLAFEIGTGDAAKLRRVFSSSIVIQLILALLLVILVETAGVWFLNSKMVIPDGRLGVAGWVLQCSLGVLVINLLAVPYNAAIIAHEKMSAFAAISIVEAVLKLSVAFLLYVSPADKLLTYSVLMLAVALIVRLSYGAYCSHNFSESRGKLVYDKALVKEMGGFAGWSFFGSSAYVFNTQGVNLVVNLFFGVALNAARGIASQVENIVKQFVSNFLTALNPQITKSWAVGDRKYCFELVFKGAKFSYLVILLFLIPFFYEAEGLLHLWLGEYPAYSPVFVRLILVALMVDLFGNPILSLLLATGDVKRYYLITGLTSYLCLPLVWIIFKLGASAEWAYVVFIGIYLIVLCLKLWIARDQTGFPVGRFLKDILLPLLLVTLIAFCFTCLCRLGIRTEWVRIVVTCLAAWISIAVGAYLLVLTTGEKAYIFRKAGRWLPDRWFLKSKYYYSTGRRLDLRNPQRYTEKVQWQKLYDRRPLYHAMVDKAEVKKLVAEIIGPDYVIPTLGVWNSPEEIDWNALPDRFVLKCTHDSGSAIICRDKSALDREDVVRRLGAAMKKNFYLRDREWAYKGLRPRIIAEQMLEGDVNDYKFFCFDGRPEFMFIATERASDTEETKFDFFDMDYNHIDVRNGHPNAAVPPVKPEGFDEMKRLAALLSRGIPQVRIDFYDVGGRIYFGEYTFYHWGGFVPFDPDEADLAFGRYFKLP